MPVLPSDIGVHAGYGSGTHLNNALKIAIGCILCLCCGVVFAGIEKTAPPPADSQQYGKKLVAEYVIDDATIAQYAAFQPSQPSKGQPKIVYDLMASTVTWHGPDLKIAPGSNPYNIVISIRAHLKEKGEADSLWLAGWRNSDHESYSLKPVTGLNAPRLDAGATFYATASALPVSLKANSTTAVSIGFTRANNLVIDQAWVQVWSGIGMPMLPAMALSGRWLWVWLIFLGMVVWFKIR